MSQDELNFSDDPELAAMMNEAADVAGAAGDVKQSIISNVNGVIQNCGTKPGIIRRLFEFGTGPSVQQYCRGIGSAAYDTSVRAAALTINKTIWTGLERLPVQPGSMLFRMVRNPIFHIGVSTGLGFSLSHFCHGYLIRLAERPDFDVNRTAQAKSKAVYFLASTAAQMPVLEGATLAKFDELISGGINWFFDLFSSESAVDMETALGSVDLKDIKATANAHKNGKHFNKK